MNANEGVILIVDDVPTNLSVLMQFLEGMGFKVLVATDGESAIEQAEYAVPDIILLDVMMPGITGFETCRRLKANIITQDIPVIFMTALSDLIDKVHGFELGAVDYITKPLHQDEVVARVNAHITLYRQKKEIERLRQQDRIYYEKLSSLKDEMLNTASHDLRNPLGAISMSVGVLHRYISPDDVRSHKKLDDIEVAVYHMRDLIENLLDLARLETGVAFQKQLISLKVLMETSAELAATSAAEKGISLQVELPPDDISITCDPSRINQVLDNLISNAIKYTPKHGNVAVRAETEESQIRFQVIDNGIGIPEEDLQKIFDKFYRVRALGYTDVPGTGLGLSIVKAIVEQHSGKVQVQSAIGVGSTFSVSLPRQAKLQ